MSSRRALLSDLALSASGALVMSLAVPPLDWWWLGLFAWLPLALIAARCPPRRAALLGWFQGTIAQRSVLWSLPAALQIAGGGSAFGSHCLAVLLAAYEGARFALIAWIAARAISRGWPLVVAFPVALVSGEWLFPMLFPWTGALFFNTAPVFLQLAELGGPALLSLWAGIVTASLASALRSEGRVARIRFGLVVPGTILVIVSGYGALRSAAVDRAVLEAPALRVGLIQGDRTEGASNQASDSIAAYRAASSALLQKNQIDLLIWPETAIDRPVPQNELRSLFQTQVFRASLGGSPRAIDVPLLTGVAVARRIAESAAHVRQRNDMSEPRLDLFNSAALVAPDGRPLGVYDKRDLVAWGETIPFEEAFPRLRSLLPKAGKFSRGQVVTPLDFGGHRILPLICFEDILPARVRSAVNEAKPELLVNLTSDAWFVGSRVPALHLALAKLRAIEQRRFLVHATNTGLTAVISPSGSVLGSLPENQPAAAATTVHWLVAPTIYDSLGDTFAWLAVVLAITACFVARSTTALAACSTHTGV